MVVASVGKLPRAAPGYCDVTEFGGDCSHDWQGAWELSATEASSWPAAREACVQRCRACTRCAFVSLSRRQHDCSWFNYCEVARLTSHADYRTLVVSENASRLRWSPPASRLTLPRVQRCIAARNATPEAASATPEAASEPRPTPASELAEAPSAKGSGLRVGIATLVVPNEANPCSGVGCALLPWCTAARRLRVALRARPGELVLAVRLLAIHGPRVRLAAAPPVGGACEGGRLSARTERFERSDCPELEVVAPSARMVRLSEAHARRLVAGGVMSYDSAKVDSMYVTLWKWELLRLGHARYGLHAVLFADLDVDLFPHAAPAPAIAAEWAAHVPELLRAGRRLAAAGPVASARFVGYGDITTPLNTALFWLVLPPTLELYNDGLSVLRAPWNHSHGFNVSGTPRQLALHLTTRHEGGEEAMRQEAPRIEVAREFGESWTRIDYGDLDQGFFLYMLHHRHRVAHAVRGSRHVAHHYVGVALKPWVRALSHDATRPRSARGCTRDALITQAYVHRARLPLHATASPCADAYRSVLAALDEAIGEDARVCCATYGLTAPAAGGHVRLSVF